MRVDESWHSRVVTGGVLSFTLKIKTNKTPVKAFTPPAEKKMGTRWSFVKKSNTLNWSKL